MRDEPRYPPEPWHLGGSMHLQLWRVPLGQLPASLDAALPTGARPVVLGGRALVGTAFVRYAPGGVLVYDELLAATLVRHGRALRVTVSDIWVDSPASEAGGRELWGIPKHLAAFERSEGAPGSWDLRARRDEVILAEARVRVGRRLPGWRRLPMRTAQRLDGVETTSRVRALARIRLARAGWHFPADSPLAWLAGQRPLLAVHLEELAIVFGTAADAPTSPGPVDGPRSARPRPPRRQP